VRASLNNIFWVARLSVMGLFRTRNAFLFVIGASILVGYFNACGIDLVFDAGERLMMTLGVLVAMFGLLFGYYFATELRNDIESRRIQPVISGPVTREEYYLGKWLSLMVPALIVVSTTLASTVFVAYVSGKDVAMGREFFSGLLRFILVVGAYLCTIYSSIMLMSPFLPSIVNLILHISVYFAFIPSLFSAHEVLYDEMDKTPFFLGILPTATLYYAPVGSRDTVWPSWWWVTSEMRNDLMWALIFLWLGLRMFKNLSLAKAQ
jgi:hypothetical protein